MTTLQLFHDRDHPGNTLRANALRALDHLDICVPLEEVEATPEQAGCALPALAVNGSIAVSGVEPTVHELELLFTDHLKERRDSPCGSCGMACGGMDGADGCPLCGGKKNRGGTAGKIIAFVILLIILFTMVKVLS